jgi:Xaa-Pro aminopeptidase
VEVPTLNERERRAQLVAAETKAETLFAAIEAGGLVAPGRSEQAVSEAIFELAERRFGVSQHWHKRIVRAGPNTVTTFFDNPEPRLIGADDTVYVDLGPVFEAWEADIGRTLALGDDPRKHRLVADLPRVFARVQAHHAATPDITGAALYAFAQHAADDAGWVFGGVIAGHLIGEFAHHTWPIERTETVIAAVNETPMRAPDHLGRDRHWILEIHLVDRDRTFGGFYERLL